MASDDRRGAEQTDVSDDRDVRSAEVPIDEVEDDPEAPLYSSVPLETEDGVVVVQQQNAGPGVEEGGGEWPDPHTPPRLPAPGAAPRERREEDDDGDTARAREQPRERS
jgi:hypothetical protein